MEIQIKFERSKAEIGLSWKNLNLRIEVCMQVNPGLLFHMRLLSLIGTQRSATLTQRRSRGSARSAYMYQDALLPTLADEVSLGLIS